MLIGDDGLVTTIKERCRRCYACVRECPAEAIRIVEAALTAGERASTGMSAISPTADQ